MCGTNNKKRKELRSSAVRKAMLAIASLMTVAVLLISGNGLPTAAAAVSYGDLSGSLKSTATYALQVSTGAVSTTGSLADEILYFKISYTDENDCVRSQRIFPAENALKNSMDWADAQVLYKEKTATDTLQISATRNEKAFQAYTTDTFFFQPLKKIKSIQSVEILMCDQVTGTANKTNGTWACQAMRIYQVSDVRGMKSYGYATSLQYADFDGTLIASMNGSQTFNWTSDRMFRITADGSGDASLTQSSESYSTTKSQKVLRMDIADSYGAGIGAMGNSDKTTLNNTVLDECAAVTVRYTDIYGATREVYLPVISGAVCYALDSGVKQDTPVSGIAEDGDTLAIGAPLPDLKSIDSVRLIYGTDAAKNVTGQSANKDKYKANNGSSHVVKDAASAGSKADYLNIIGFSVYDGEDVKVSIEGTKLTPVFDGSPISYYRASTVSGTSIQPVSKGNSGIELPLTAYESGAKLLPEDTSERYLVILHTDDTDLAGTTSNMSMTLSYTDVSKQAKTSDTIDVVNAVNNYYGAWPGVKAGFMYRVGARNGGSLYFTVSLKNVEQFTGANFIIQGTDNWQMKGMEIYRLDELSTLSGEWTTDKVTDGKESTDRTYSRTYTGTQMLLSKETLLVDGGEPTSITFGSDDSSSGSDADKKKDTGDWSEHRYSLDYETAKSLGRFAKSRYNYSVAVEVGSDQVTDSSDGDCGSKNQFYFQLVFEDGKSAYVLANQQLASDGFRSGYTESFTISTNRDMGELTAVKILPEDTADKSDVFDKLKIDSICVVKQTTEAVSRQWVINNVGWIDIDYQDEAADSSSTDYAGRNESEIVRTYQVETSTYAVNLEFAITTGAYGTDASTNEAQPQFVGQMYGIVEYYDSNGVQKKQTFNLVDAMYTYAGQERKIGTSETIGQYTWPGGTESDPTYMFRAGKTDRFTLGIEDISQLIRVTLEVRSKVSTTLNIQSMYVSLAGSGGRRFINTQDEYQWDYENKTKQLCSSMNSGANAYSVALPINQVQTMSIDFTENKIVWADASQGEITSVTSRLPRSADDTLNIYVYPDASETAATLKNAKLKMAAQYSRIYGGFNQIEATMYQGESNGQVRYFAIGVPASSIDTLNSLALYAQFADNNATGEFPLSHAVVQQVRSGVVMNTFYIDFSGCDATVSGGVSREPTLKPGSDQFRQTVTLAFSDAMSTLHLTPESDDVAVALRYTTTNDVRGQVYESANVYLTDQNYSEISAGKLVELTFNEPYVKDIVGIKISGTGHSTRSSVIISSATASAYETDLVSGTESCTGSFSFANGIKLSTGQSNQVMERSGSVSQLTLSFTVPEVKDVAAAAENADGEVAMQINYKDSNGATKTMNVNDILDYAAADASFQPGSTVTVNIMMPNVSEVRWISLSPKNTAGDAGTLTLNDVTATLQTGSNKTSYQRSLTDWSGTGVIPLFNSVQLKLTATTKTPSSGTSQTIQVDSGTKQVLVESGQEVAITPKLTGSASGYTYRVEKFKGSYSSSAPEVLTQTGSTLRFKADNEYSSGVGAETYYRVIVSSKELPSVQTIMEFVVEPKYVAPTVVEEDKSEAGNTSTTTEE